MSSFLTETFNRQGIHDHVMARFSWEIMVEITDLLGWVWRLDQLTQKVNHLLEPTS